MAEVIVFYGVPAFGHINAMLFLAETLVQGGYRVVFYATESFKQSISETGAEYRTYPIAAGFSEADLDLRDTSRLLAFYHIVLHYTELLYEPLLADIRHLKPVCIVHDSVAHWGYRLGQTTEIPSISFYSLVAINHVNNPSFWSYALNFSPTFFKDVTLLPQIFALKWRLAYKYGFMTSLLRTLMNKQKLNILSYNRALQIGGAGFDQSYFFLGPTSIQRPYISKGEPALGLAKGRKIIYVSLGTIFNQNEAFYRRLIAELAMSEYFVLIANSAQAQMPIFRQLPSNIWVSTRVDQRAVLQEASLFITASGNNSVAEAIYYGVPCLLAPQQGEQELTARRMVALGFGLLYQEREPLLKQVKQALQLRQIWNEQKAQKISQVRTKQLWLRIKDYIGG